MASAETFLTTGRKIVAIGRNFRYKKKKLFQTFLFLPLITDTPYSSNSKKSEHAKELNNAVPKSPFFFLKPTSSYLENRGKIEIPQNTEVHHESKVEFA